MYIINTHKFLIRNLSFTTHNQRKITWDENGIGIRKLIIGSHY